MITVKLGSALCSFIQLIFDEESESKLSSGGMILELQETDSIKLDFDLEPVNMALTTGVSIQSKSTSKSSLSASMSGQKILLGASASKLLNPHLYYIVKL